MVCEASSDQASLDSSLTFSSLFIGMVCEAQIPDGLGALDAALSVPSSSGWCVKQIQGLASRARPLYFQFPLHRDGV